MTEDEIGRRVRAAVEKTVAAQEERRQTRRGMDARRTYGLQRRHTEKLARLDAAAAVGTPDGRCRYLVDVEATPPRPCPNEAIPSGTLCSPHTAAAVELARRLGLLAEGQP